MKRTVNTLAGLLLALISLQAVTGHTQRPVVKGHLANLSIPLSASGAAFLPANLPAATTWKIADGYSIQFDGKGASGSFTGLKGEIVFDEKDLGNSHFNVTVSAASVNTNNNLKNKHAKSEKYLDVEKFPLIKFTSSSIKASGNGYTATGTLEIHGVKQQISMPFQFKATNNGGVFTSNIEVSRETYQIGSSSWLLGDKFKVDISVPVTK